MPLETDGVIPDDRPSPAAQRGARVGLGGLASRCLVVPTDSRQGDSRIIGRTRRTVSTLPSQEVPSGGREPRPAADRIRECPPATPTNSKPTCRIDDDICQCLQWCKPLYASLAFGFLLSEPGRGGLNVEIHSLEIQRA